MKRARIAILIVISVLATTLFIANAGPSSADHVAGHIYRVNVGGGDIADSGNGAWIGINADGTDSGVTLTGADTDGVAFPDGEVVDKTDVDAELPDQMFEETRVNGNNPGAMTFDFDVPNGTYTVDLHFLEHNDTITGPGERVFDVTVEGALALDDYDPLAVAGVHFKGESEQVSGVVVADGVLTIVYTNGVSFANPRGIEITQTAGGANTPPTIDAVPNPATVTAGTVGAVTVTTGDVDGDTVTVSDIANNTGGFAVLNGGGTQLNLNPDAGDVAGSPYSVTLQADDGNGGTTNEVVTINVNAAGTVTTAYRINAGPDIGVDPNPLPAVDGGADWDGVGNGATGTGDEFTIAGVTFATQDNAADVQVADPWTGVPADVPVGLFGSLGRTAATAGDTMNWDFDLPDGDYNIRLFFGEQTSSTIDNVGDRDFDVSLEGNVVLDDYDMLGVTNPGVADGDPGTKGIAIEEVFTDVAVVGGLDLDITAVTSVAIIRGIEIAAAGAPDTTPPVITRNGAAVVNLTEGDNYVDAGASALDDVDGAVAVTTTGVPGSPVAVGNYTVRYNAMDSSGNDAVEVTRTVNVAAKQPAELDNNRIFVTNVIQSGPAEYDFLFGKTDEEILTGDWDGNGHDGFARRRGNTIVEVDEFGAPIRTVMFGDPSDTLYRVGDWDCDGTDTLAVQRGNVFHITNSPTAAGPTTAIGYGKAGDQVYVGDWDGDDCDTFAVRRANIYYVRNSVTTGVADVVFAYGRAADEVLIGNWDQLGGDSFAVRRGNVIYIRNDFMTGVAETVIGYGKASDDLLVGDWNGDLVDTFAVRRTEAV